MDSLLAAVRVVGVALRDALSARRADSGVDKLAVAPPKRDAVGLCAGDWLAEPGTPVGVLLGLMMSRLALGLRLKLSSTELSYSSRPPNRDF